jgi:hypothetical protein
MPPSYRPAFEMLEDRCVPTTLLTLAAGATQQQNILAFDSANPGVVFSSLPVIGLQSGDSLFGLDYRPATLGLYGLAATGSQVGHGITTLRLYTINQTTGAATLVSPAAGVTVGGASNYYFDFNPYTDQIRVIGSDGENMRLSPGTGTLIATDPTLTNGTSSAPFISGIAYTPGNAFANASSLFAVAQPNLDIVNSDGTLTPVGSLGNFFLTNFTGLDIAPNASASAGTAYTVTNDIKFLFPSSVETVNLATGATTGGGQIGNISNPLQVGAIKTTTVTVVPTATFTPPSTSPSLPANATAGERFVAQIFLDLLGRNPSQSDLTTLGASIDQGLISHMQFVLAVQQSPEYLTRLVNQDYLSILGRTADPTGLAGGVQFLATGESNQALRAILYGSSEYFHSVGGTNNAFLSAVFRATTGQTIDANSLNILNGLLNSGVSPTTISQLLLQTPAAAQQVVIGFFQRYLGRTPGPAEVAAHAGLVQTGQAGLDQALILSSPEFLKLINA